MCGIVGYTGNRQAAPILLEGLAKLEYRGYDSAGLAVRDGDGETEIVKAKGRLRVLEEKTNGGQAMKGCCGIGHTRWATHGEPSVENAHPHCSDDGNVVAVHNGIIENYQELKEKLLRKGYQFYSSTDTEVAVKLIDYYYKKYLGTPVDALNHAMVRIRGSYALAVLFKDYPEEIYAARKDSPMIIGVTEGESYLASDVPAILKYTRNVYYIGNMEIGRLRRGEVTFYNLDGEEIQKEQTEIQWDAEAAEKAGFEHFMMKEIHEQPKAVEDTIHSMVKDGAIDLSEAGITQEILREISQVYIVACGSALPCGRSGPVRHGRSGRDSRAGGTGLGVPLPAYESGSGGAGGHHQPVRGDRRQSGGPAQGKRGGSADSGHCQCGGVPPLPGRRTTPFIPWQVRRSPWPPPRPTAPS